MADENREKALEDRIESLEAENEEHLEWIAEQEDKVADLREEVEQMMAQAEEPPEVREKRIAILREVQETLDEDDRLYQRIEEVI